MEEKISQEMIMKAAQSHSRIIDYKAIMKDESLVEKEILDAFMSGIRMFQKAQWKDAKCIPDEGSEIYYIARLDGEVVDSKITITSLYDVMPWSEVVEKYSISEWAYTDDLRKPEREDDQDIIEEYRFCDGCAFDVPGSVAGRCIGCQGGNYISVSDYKKKRNEY